MKRDLSEALDKSLTLLETSQATLEECLARYPKLAVDLRPLLEVALEVRRVPSLTSSSAAFDAGKQRMLQALAEKERRQMVSSSPLHRYAGWITALFGKRESPIVQRRAFQLALATALTLVLFAISAFSFLSWLGGTVTQTTVLAQANGVVEVMPAGSDTWRPALVGERVAVGDRVRTGPLSAVTLAFFDGSATDLAAETEITIVQTSSQRNGDSKAIVLCQWLGRTRNRVEQLSDPSSRFEIETPSASVTVHGTVFIVQVTSDGATQVVVEEGRVKVSAQETTVEIGPGQATTVQPGLPLTPTGLVPTLTPPPLPQPTSTMELTKTPKPTATEEPTETSEPTATEEPEEPTGTPELTATEEPEEPTEVPEPTTTRKPEEPTRVPKPTATEKPEEPTEVPEPTETEEPESTEEPEPTATEEPEEPTEVPEPTETEEPESTEEPEPTATEDSTESL